MQPHGGEKSRFCTFLHLPADGHLVHWCKHLCLFGHSRRSRFAFRCEQDSRLSFNLNLEHHNNIDTVVGFILLFRAGVITVFLPIRIVHPMHTGCGW